MSAQADDYNNRLRSGGSVDDAPEVVNNIIRIRLSLRKKLPHLGIIFKDLVSNLLF